MAIPKKRSRASKNEPRNPHGEPESVPPNPGSGEAAGAARTVGPDAARHSEPVLVSASAGVGEEARQSHCDGPDSADAFVGAIRSSLEKGFGFVPLVGAGLSAPSGVPIIVEIRDYLKKCIAMALGLDHEKAWSPERPTGARELQNFFRWLPGRDAWPPFGDPQIYDRDTVDWAQRLGAFVSELHRVQKEEPERNYRELGIFQEAYGAMAEWRTSLIFLSRLRLASEKREDDERSRLVLGPPDLDVIDTFFLNVVLGKRPTLGHRMLARLALPLRINTILTTNFDDLIEKAFEEVGNVLTVFDVHVLAGLPPYRDMQFKSTLVKLHGGRYGLRADYTLDVIPSESDRRQFVSYLADRVIIDNVRGPTSELLEARRHLLVLGVSASDERVIALIHTAQRKLKETFKIFWVAYRKVDEEMARELLTQFFGKNAERSRFHILQHKFPGLLFLELYQELMRAFPTSGAVFPSAPRVPCPPRLRLPANDQGKQSDDQGRITTETLTWTNLVGRINAAIKKLSEESTVPCRLLVVHCDYRPTTPGVSIMSKVFDMQLDQQCQCVWIDMDEIADTEELFEIMLDSIARKAGVVDWMPVSLARLGSVRDRVREFPITEISRLTNNPNRKWVVFLNARSVPGANLPDGAKEYSNGWLDIASPADDFIKLLQCLCGTGCPNVTVVLLCFDSPFLSRLSVSACNYEPLRLTPVFRDSEGDHIKQVLAWLDEHDEEKTLVNEKEIRAQFLYSLCLANRPRYPGFLWGGPFYLGLERTALSADKRVELSKKWTLKLERIRVVRQKPGGFLWMHCIIRNQLRKMLPDLFPTLKDRTAETHHGLAESYRRLLLASRDAAAAFEVVYHRCMQAAALLEERGDKCPVEALQALTDARLCLELAQPDLVASGFTKGLCRRLEHIRDYLLMTVVRSLKVDPQKAEKSFYKEVKRRIALLHAATLRLNRLIAREVGENAIAFLRHLQLRAAHLSCLTDKTASSNPSLEEWYRGLLDDAPNGEPLLPPNDLLARHVSGAKTELLAAWIEQETELGTLSIAARAYDYAKDRTFAKVFNAIGFPAAHLNPTSTRNIREDCQKWLLDAWQLYQPKQAKRHNLDVPNFRDFILSLCRLLQRYMQLHLVWGHTLHTAGRRETDPVVRVQVRAAADEKFQTARRCYESAVELMREANSDRARVQNNDADDTFGSEDLPAWFRIRQRLDVQDALAWTFLREYREAHRRLNEAEAAVITIANGPRAIEMAIIELHRAELLTHQAVCVYEPTGEKLDPWVKGMSPLGVMRREILNKLQDQPFNFHDSFARPNNIVSGLLDELLACTGRQKGDRLKQPLSFVDEAWQTLNRAEPLLIGNRKNVWWTTWYFELKLKLIELKVYAQLCQDDFLAMPHIGLRDIPYGAPTAADRLLENARRMSRLDVFRIARIVESYANILLGLILARRLVSTKASGNVDLRMEAVLLSRRQSQMKIRLDEAREDLTTRTGYRIEHDRKLQKKRELQKQNAAALGGASQASSFKLCRDVEKYLHFVDDHARKISYLAFATSN